MNKENRRIYKMRSVQTPSAHSALNVGVSRQRPLSPHIGVFNAEYSSILSIFHRISGIVLAVLLIVVALANRVLVYNNLEVIQILEWLSLPEGVQSSLFSFLLSFVFSILVFCVSYHLTNGIRHLIWDMGLGIKKNLIQTTGLAVIGIALFLTIGFLFIASM